MAASTWNALTDDQRIALHILFHDCAGEWQPGRKQPRLRSDAHMLRVLDTLVTLELVGKSGKRYGIRHTGIDLIPDSNEIYED
jgi:hypothetical protein